MDWQTPIAIALAVCAGAYALWRWTRPFFNDNTATPQQDHDGLLQIESSDD